MTGEDTPAATTVAAAPGSTGRQRLLFTLLYFSEGVPIGFLWWALPAVLLQPLGRADKLLKVAILFISAILFIFTRNFWLCWIFHAAAWLLLASGEPQTDLAADQ